MSPARHELGRHHASRTGRVPVWIPWGLLVACVIWVFSGLTDAVRAAGLERIDPRSSRLEANATFLDPRWNDILRERMATLPSVSPRDRLGIQRIAASVAALPFVARVGEPRVLWPDGVDVPLELRRPAACVMQGGEFLNVAEDGTLLPGRWPSPRWCELLPGREGFLPVIGPNDGAFDVARPGERLREARHIDALAVALSMRENLSADDFKLLGPPLVDATNARSASVEIPGVAIQLERRRTVWFGRAPGCGAVGERPVERKWADVHKAALRLKGLEATPIPPDARDWSLLDVRWDTSDITWREPLDPAGETSDAKDPAHAGGHSSNGAGHAPEKSNAKAAPKKND